MSVKVMGKVWDLQLPHNQLLVLLAMADHADHDGSKVFPSIGLIAWKTGYSEKQVHRIQRELVKLGILVEVNRTQGKSVLYRIETSKGTEKKPYTPRQYVTPDKMSVQTFDTPNPSQNVPTTSDMASLVLSAEPSLNHHREPSVMRKSAKSSKADLEAKAIELIKAWVIASGGVDMGQSYDTTTRKAKAREMLKWDKPVTCGEVTEYIKGVVASGKDAPDFVWLPDRISVWRGLQGKANITRLEMEAAPPIDLSAWFTPESAYAKGMTNDNVE